MENPIDFLMNLELELTCLSGLCDVLCCVGGSNDELCSESVGNSFFVLRELLIAKAAEAGRVVEEYYASRNGKLDTNRESKGE